MAKPKYQPNPIIKQIKSNGSDGVTILEGFVGETHNSIVDVYPDFDLSTCVQIPESAIVEIKDGESDDQPAKLYVKKDAKLKYVLEVDLADVSRRGENNRNVTYIKIRKPSPSKPFKVKGLLVYDGKIYEVVDETPGFPGIEDPVVDLACVQSCESQYGECGVEPDPAKLIECKLNCN